MYLPKSILYPLIVLFTLGGIISFYFKINTSHLILCLILVLMLYFVIRKKSLILLKSSLLYFGFIVMGILHFQEYYRLPKSHFENQTIDSLNALKRIKIVKTVGSNAPWFVERWKKTCEKYKVDFYDTREKGVLKINLENGE